MFMTDTERIDWLEKHECWLDCGDQSAVEIMVRRPGNPMQVATWRGTSIRAAVDLAAANHSGIEIIHSALDVIQKIREQQTKTLELLRELATAR
jgi:translation initiation factor 2 alpha subunit (eIF-2alpha)